MTYPFCHFCLQKGVIFGLLSDQRADISSDSLDSIESVAEGEILWVKLAMIF